MGSIISKVNTVPQLATDAAGRKSIDGVFAGDDRPILVMGGDHPYAQWSSNNNGMARAYLDRGITPYCAVCWDGSEDRTSGNGATFSDVGGGIDMLTLSQAKSLAGMGVEFVSHATRHANSWNLFNTGIRIKYLGAASAPTVLISTTGVTLTGAGGGENATLTWASYPTLAQLKTAIGSKTNWICYLAYELTGLESSSMLAPIKTARNVALTSDATASVQRFALSGGVLVKYTGTAYDSVKVWYGADNFIRIYADGVRIALINITTGGQDTLAGLVTTINALAIAGLTATLMDNGYSTQVTKFRETYCWGDELCTGIMRNEHQDANLRGAMLQVGVGIHYAIRRNIEAATTAAAAAGLPLRNFAQPGGDFERWLHRTSLDTHNAFRLGTSLGGKDAPAAMQMARMDEVSLVYTATNDNDSSHTTAMLDALADSPGFYVDTLIHKILPDGSSGYSFINPDGYYDQTESDFIAFLDHAKTLRDAGRIHIMSPEQARIARSFRTPPKNMFFNPLFKNCGTTLLGATSFATGSNGKRVPGWRITSGSSDFSTFAINDGELTLVTNGALGATKYPLQQQVMLERGKTYELGAMLDLSALPSSANVKITIFPVLNQVGDDMGPAPSAFITSTPYYGGGNYDGDMYFSVPNTEHYSSAKIVSLVGPFNLSATAHVTINYDGIGAVADINIAGATPASTTATEIAAAINAAIKGSGAYAQREEYWSIAKAVRGRVVITAPYMQASPQGQTLYITNGTSGSPMQTVFGGTETRAIGQVYDKLDTSYLAYNIAWSISSGANGTVKIKAPYLKPLKC